jgi:hypothetical protein
MNKKIKKKITNLRKKLVSLRTELAGEKEQSDEPELIPILEKKIAATEKEIQALKNTDINEGDLIQWEVQGCYFFEKPQKIIRIEESPEGKFVFVENHNCGIPIHQVVKQ